MTRVVKRSKQKITQCYLISDETDNSDPPICNHVNEETLCKDKLARKTCPKACGDFEGIDHISLFQGEEWILSVFFHCKHM